MAMSKINDDCMFFGLELTEEQTKFRDAIYDGNKDIIFSNSKAGTGKTLIAVATAKMLVAEKGYDGLIYIVSVGNMEKTVGFLPGTIEEKIAPYSQPLEDALIKIGEQPEKAIFNINDDPKKQKNAWVYCISHTFLRGVNFENKVVIIDEFQNMYLDEAKKVLTRMHDNCRVICIGHSQQCDLYKNKQNSGFVKYIEHFSKFDRCAVVNLTHNFRGWLSRAADEVNE